MHTYVVFIFTHVTTLSSNQTLKIKKEMYTVCFFLFTALFTDHVMR